jgi:hypothetical protein
MLTINTGQLTNLATSLLKGDTSSLDRLIMKSFENAAKNLVNDLISSAGPLASILAAAQEGAGLPDRIANASDYRKMRDSWLNSLQPSSPHSGLLGNISNSIQKAFSGATQENNNNDRWTWSKSRREWLDESWKHDWRSQPRDKRGRWIKGRLKTIYISSGARKARNKRRRIVRKQVKELFRGN